MLTYGQLRVSSRTYSTSSFTSCVERCYQTSTVGTDGTRKRPESVSDTGFRIPYTKVIQKTTMKIFEHLRHRPHAPSTGFIDTSRTPALGLRQKDGDDQDPDVRHVNRRPRHHVDYEGNDIEDDDQYISSLRRAKRKQRRINFPRRRYPAAESPRMPDGGPMRLTSPKRAVENVANGEANSSTERQDENMKDVKQNGAMEESEDDSHRWRARPLQRVEGRNRQAKGAVAEESDDGSLREESDDNSLRWRPRAQPKVDARIPSVKGGAMEESDDDSLRWKRRTQPEGSNPSAKGAAIEENDDDSLKWKPKTQPKAEGRNPPAKGGAMEEDDDDSNRWKARTHPKIETRNSSAKGGTMEASDDDSLRWKSQDQPKAEDRTASARDEDADEKADPDVSQPPRMVMNSMHRIRGEGSKTDTAPGDRRTVDEDARRGRSMMESSFGEAVNRRLRDQAEDGTGEIDAERTNATSASDEEEGKNADEEESRKDAEGISNGRNGGENGLSREGQAQTAHSGEGGDRDDKGRSVLGRPEDISGTRSAEAQQRPEVPELNDFRDSALPEGKEDNLNNEIDEEDIDDAMKSTEENPERSEVAQEMSTSRPANAPRIDAIVEGLRGEDKDINSSPSNRDTPEVNRGLEKAEKDMRRTEDGSCRWRKLRVCST
ncbi:hypothetical protein FGB62_386g01 [Gracilaria domingensis]|nr:hypothetical protein FGB62_386g01 [Gracilaria domingensis]